MGTLISLSEIEIFKEWYASIVGLYPPLGPGTPLTRLRLLSDCIWLRIVPGFLFMTSAMSSPFMDFPSED